MLTKTLREALLRIDAVIFDVDGTLYPNRLMYIKSMSFFLTYPRFTAHFGKIRGKIRSIRPIEDFQELQIEMLSRSMKISFERAKRFILDVMYTRWEECLKGVPTYPSVGKIMAELREQGKKIGVLSDFPIGRKLTYLGLDSFVDFAASTEESGYLKPNPEPFTFVAERLRVQPERALYVGNHYEYDVKGASAAGMRTAHLAKRPKKSSIADFTFHDYGCFMESFRSLAQPQE